MPDRDTIRAATPRCPHRVVSMNSPRACGLPLKWHHDDEAWKCDRHGRVIPLSNVKTAA